MCQVHVWIVLYWPHLPPCLHQAGQDDHARQHWPGRSLWLGGSHIFVVTGALLTLKLRTCGQSSLNLRVLKTPSWPLVLTSPHTTSIRWSIQLEEEIPIAPSSLQLDEYRRKWPSSKVGQPGRLGIQRDISLLSKSFTNLLFRLKFTLNNIIPKFRLQGLNTGVVLYHLERMRESLLYNSYLHPEAVDHLMER